MLFSIDTTEVYRSNVQQLLLVATIDLEIAVCLLFAADLLARAGEEQRAVMLLALAFRYPMVAEGWISRFPEIVAMQQKLRNRLSPADYASARAQGQALDLRVTAEAVVAELATASEID